MNSENTFYCNKCGKEDICSDILPNVLDPPIGGIYGDRFVRINRLLYCTTRSSTNGNLFTCIMRCSICREFKVSDNKMYCDPCYNMAIEKYNNSTTTDKFERFIKSLKICIQCKHEGNITLIRKGQYLCTTHLNKLEKGDYCIKCIDPFKYGYQDILEESGFCNYCTKRCEVCGITLKDQNSIFNYCELHLYQKCYVTGCRCRIEKFVNYIGYCVKHLNNAR